MHYIHCFTHCPTITAKGAYGHVSLTRFSLWCHVLTCSFCPSAIRTAIPRARNACCPQLPTTTSIPTHHPTSTPPHPIEHSPAHHSALAPSHHPAAARVVTNTNRASPMKSTRAPSSPSQEVQRGAPSSPSQEVQRGLSELPDVATQAHWGPRSQGSDHGSRSQCGGTEKRAGERHLPSRSDSTRKGTHHIVKRPDEAGVSGPARGPTHLHPTQDNTVNPASTRSYVEVVRGVALRSGRPTTTSGPPHVTRYILLPRAPTHTPQHPSARGAPALAHQRHAGEGRGFALRSPMEGLSAGTWRRKVVMCPRRGNGPASGHTRAHQPPLGGGTSPPAWDGRLEAPGQRRRHLPSSAWTRRREVK